MNLTKTSYLVLFIVLISVGVGTASALLTITFEGFAVFKEDVQMDKNLNVDGILTGVVNCDSELAQLASLPNYMLPDECAPGTIPAILIKPGTGVSCTGSNCFSVLTDNRSIVSGELDNTDSSWTRLNDCFNTGSGTQFFEEWVLLVDVAGNYKFTLQAEPQDFSDEEAVFDAFLLVYSPSFSSVSPLIDCLDVNDDDGSGISLETDSELTVDLTVDSRVVVTSFSNNEEGNYNIIAERVS